MTDRIVDAQALREVLGMIGPQEAIASGEDGSAAILSILSTHPDSTVRRELSAVRSARRRQGREHADRARLEQDGDEGDVVYVTELDHLDNLR